MITTTCLIGVLAGALTSASPSCPATRPGAVRAVVRAGDAVAAAAVSPLAARPATATTQTRLISVSFMGFPSPPVSKAERMRGNDFEYSQSQPQHEVRDQPRREQKVKKLE